jgi:RNA polymerase sigma-70 factor (ECF subfamily)
VSLAFALENRRLVSDVQREGPLAEQSEVPRASDPEAELLGACRRGDLSAFERLYETHGTRMKSLAMNLLNNRSDAEDAVQETFLKIYRAAASFRGSAKLSTWTYRVLVNTCYDVLRRRVRATGTTEGAGATEAVLDARAPEADHPLRMDLEASLAVLKPKHRTAFLLFEVEGFTHREVGDILGVSEGTSRGLLFEARRELQRLLFRTRSAREARA